MKIMKSEILSRERNPERKFFRGGPFSSKRTRESQVESVYSSANRGRILSIDRKDLIFLATDIHFSPLLYLFADNQCTFEKCHLSF